MSKLLMVVPGDRARCGRALLVTAGGDVKVGPFRVLATANRKVARRHGNPRRDKLRPFGHPPAGTFLLAGSLPPGVTPNPKRARRFGRLGALVLTPDGGEALAALANGRRRVYLHGGPPNRRGRLRPTLGGFRVADDNLARLLRAINDAFAGGDPVESVEVVEIAPALEPKRSPEDAVGKGKPAPARPRHAALEPRRSRRVSLKHAAIMLGGLGLRRPRDGEAPPEDPSRREAVAFGLLLLGSFGATACFGPDDPSPSDCVSCDPLDPSCPPGGYLCPGDVLPADPSGGAGGDDGEGGGASGDPSGGDTGDPGSGDSGGAG